GTRRLGISGRHPGVTRFLSPYLSSTRRLFLDAYPPGGAMDDVPPLRRVDPRQVSTALNLLRFADPGIADVEIVEQQDTDQVRGRYDLHLVHRAGGESATFPLSEESDGTQAWFRLIGPTLTALRAGRLLLLD